MKAFCEMPLRAAFLLISLFGVSLKRPGTIIRQLDFGGRNCAGSVGSGRAQRHPRNPQSGQRF